MCRPFVLFRFLLACCLLLFSRQTLAWGPDGHHTVAAIADELLAGTNAAAQAKAILGTLSFEEAAVWADCAKGVKPPATPGGTFTYEGAGTYPECSVHETPAGEAEMIDFVKRNATNCALKPGEEICHKQYHYADIAPQHDHYDTSFHGARIDDIVAAVAAATHVLKGDAAPSPFNFKDKHEALLVLFHYAGDIHQPLHVGAVYLNANGKRVNPDSGTFDPNTETRGGNDIKVTSSSHNLHATWDHVSSSLTLANVNATWLAQAKAVPGTAGQINTWPTTWASDTQKQAIKAYKTLTFSKRTGPTWTTTLPTGYTKSMEATKRVQLTKAGARLAQLLKAIWP